MAETRALASKVAAAGILLLILLLFWSYLFGPYFSYLERQREELSAAQRKLAGYRQLIRSETEITRAVGSLEKADDGDSLFLPGASHAIASAKLRELISDYIDSAGARIISSQEYEGANLPGTRFVGLRVQFNGEAENLVNLLHALESAQPLLFVDEINVTAPRQHSARLRRLRAGQASSPAPVRQSLNVRLDIAGYIRLPSS